MALQHPQHYHHLQRVRQCEGKSTIPTINPFCDTSNDTKGNGGEAECRGQKRTKHFSQSCVLPHYFPSAQQIWIQKAIVAKGDPLFLWKGDGDWRPSARWPDSRKLYRAENRLVFYVQINLQRVQ